MKNHSEYFQAITLSMIAFQHLEELLKMVLIRIEVLTHHRIKDFAKYDLNKKGESIKKAPLGRLISMYKIFTEDESLFEELKVIQAERDQVAHQSLLLTVDETQDEALMENKIENLEEVKNRCYSVFPKLSDRWNELDLLLKKQTTEQDVAI